MRMAARVILSLTVGMALNVSLMAAEASKAAPAAPIYALRGHETGIGDVQFSPDGKRVVSLSKEVIQLWDTATGKAAGTLTPAKDVGRLAFSGDGKLLAAAGESTHVFVWDLAGPKQKADIDLKCNSYGLALSPDGTLVALNVYDSSAGKDTFQIRVYEVSAGKEVSRFVLNQNSMSNEVGLVFSHDGRTLASTVSNRDNDNVVAIDPKTGNKLWSLRDPESAPTVLAFSTDDKTLATSGRVTRRWDVATRQEKTKPANAAASNRFSWLGYTSDGKFLATGLDYSGGSGFNLLNATTGDIARKYTLTQSATPRLVSVSSDGTMAAAAIGRTLKIWKLNPAGGELTLMGGTSPTPVTSHLDGNTMIIEGNEDNVGALAFSPDGAKVYTAGNDFSLRGFETATGKQFFSVYNFTSTNTKLYVIEDGKRLMFGGNLFDAATGKADGKIGDNNGAEKSQMTLASAANVGAAASFNQGVGFWDGPKARASGFIKMSSRPLWVALSPDGKTAYAFENNSGIHVLDATSGTEMGIIKAANPRSLTVTPDGKTIVLRTNDSVTLLDAGTREQVATAKMAIADDMKITVSSDGKRAFTSGNLVELPSLKVLGKVKEFDGMSCAAFSPDSKSIAVTQLDRIRIIKVADIGAAK
jgi:WD40 repeat protein